MLIMEYKCNYSKRLRFSRCDASCRKNEEFDTLPRGTFLVPRRLAQTVRPASTARRRLELLGCLNWPASALNRLLAKLCLLRRCLLRGNSSLVLAIHIRGIFEVHERRLLAGSDFDRHPRDAPARLFAAENPHDIIRMRLSGDGAIRLLLLIRFGPGAGDVRSVWIVGKNRRRRNLVARIRRTLRGNRVTGLGCFLACFDGEQVSGRRFVASADRIQKHRHHLVRTGIDGDLGRLLRRRCSLRHFGDIRWGRAGNSHGCRRCRRSAAATTSEERTRNDDGQRYDAAIHGNVPS